MGRKSFKKHQKLYKMKGCSKKNKKTRKHLVGGGLAYTGEPSNIGSLSNLAYTGKGGSTSDTIRLPLGADVMSPIANLPSNPNGANPVLPNTGPVTLTRPTIPTNLGSAMMGGACGTCMAGGGCGCNLMAGGKTLDPQGLVGSPWTPNSQGWPGVDGISGNRNYLDYNNYKVDPQTALISMGANRPFLFGGKRRKKKCNTKRRKQRGGALSNLLGQDFINLGRQIQYNMGSTYNALNGYAAPTPVLPWQGQLPRTPNLNTIRGAAL